MSADLVLRNGRLVTPAGIRNGGVAVRDGRISAIADDYDLPAAAETIDCRGNVVLPGLVDPHVHLGGATPYDQNCVTECRSAAAGGVTTILQYRRSTPSFLESFPPEREMVERTFMLDTGFHFIISNVEQALEIPEYAKRFGITTFKFYMGGYEPNNPIGLVVADDAVMYTAMERIRELGPYGFCMTHCEDQALFMMLTDRMKKSGRSDLAAYSESRPGFVEEQDVLRAIWLAELLGCPLYIPHTTIGSAVEAAVAARQRGVKVLIETCPHYLALTADDERLARQGAGVGKVSPALRDRHNQDRLWWGLANGYIHTIGSDHVPIAKTGGSLWDERPGFAGLGAMLPVLLNEGVHKGRITLEKLVEVTAFNPARIFGYAPQKGSIAVGLDADLVVVDMNKEQIVGPDSTHSQFTSAFEEMTLRGWPVITIRRGEIVFRDGQVLGKPGTGRILERTTELAAA